MRFPRPRCLRRLSLSALVATSPASAAALPARMRPRAVLVACLAGLAVLLAILFALSQPQCSPLTATDCGAQSTPRVVGAQIRIVPFTPLPSTSTSKTTSSSTTEDRDRAGRVLIATAAHLATLLASRGAAAVRIAPSRALRDPDSPAAADTATIAAAVRIEHPPPRIIFEIDHFKQQQQPIHGDHETEVTVPSVMSDEAIRHASVEFRPDAVVVLAARSAPPADVCAQAATETRLGALVVVAWLADSAEAADPHAQPHLPSSATPLWLSPSWSGRTARCPAASVIVSELDIPYVPIGPWLSRRRPDSHAPWLAAILAARHSMSPERADLADRSFLSRVPEYAHVFIEDVVHAIAELVHVSLRDGRESRMMFVPHTADYSLHHALSSMAPANFPYPTCQDADQCMKWLFGAGQLRLTAEQERRTMSHRIMSPDVRKNEDLLSRMCHAWGLDVSLAQTPMMEAIRRTVAWYDAGQLSTPLSVDAHTVHALQLTGDTLPLATPHRRALTGRTSDDYMSILQAWAETLQVPAVEYKGCINIVYTVVFGERDPLPRLKSYMADASDTCFYAFVTPGVKSDGYAFWRVRTVSSSPPIPLSMRVLSRIPKIMAHWIFPQASWTTYIDAKWRLDDASIVDDMTALPRLKLPWRAFTSTFYTTAAEELQSMVDQGKFQVRDHIMKLVERAAMAGVRLDAGHALMEGAVQVRNVQHADVRELSERWLRIFLENLPFERDQQSFVMAIAEAGLFSHGQFTTAWGWPTMEIVPFEVGNGECSCSIVQTMRSWTACLR
jgi:hypothetical protein